MPDVPPIIEKLVRTAQGFDFRPPYRIYVPVGYPDLPNGFEFKGHKIYQTPGRYEYRVIDSGGSYVVLFQGRPAARRACLYLDGGSPNVMVEVSNA